MNFLILLISIALCCALIAVVVAARDKRLERLKRHMGHQAAKPERSSPKWKLHPAHHGKASALVLCALAFSAGALTAQEVVHARVGKLVSNNPSQHSLTIKGENGVSQTFRTQAAPDSGAQLEDWLKGQAVPPLDFHQVGDRVVVLYYGYGLAQTAVAIEDLGATPESLLHGTVAHFDKHDHAMDVRSGSTGVKTVTLSDKTIVDTPDGVVSGTKFHPSKDETVDVIVPTGDPGKAAPFLSAL